MKKILIYYSIILLLLVGCRPELQIGGEGPDSGEATLYLHLQPQKLASITKAGEVQAQHGDKMNNVRVFLVNSANSVVAYASSERGSVVFNAEHTEADAVHANISAGIYTLYVVANVPESFPYDHNTSTINNAFKQATVSLAAGVYEPTYSEEQGMPLSVMQQITILSGENHLSTELLRICGRLRVYLSNKTSAADNLNLCINSISFNAKNPDRSYIFSDGSSTPAYNTRSFMIYNNIESPLHCIASGDTELLYDSYMFETGDKLAGLRINIIGGVVSNSLNPEIEHHVLYHTNENAGVYAASTEVGSKYLIKNADANYYLRKPNSGSTLTGEVITNVSKLQVEDKFPNFLWEITENTNSDIKIKHTMLESNSYIVIPQSTDAPSLAYPGNTKYDNNGSLYRERSSTRFYQMYYDGSLKTKADVRNTRYSTNQYTWLFYPVTETESSKLINAVALINHKSHISYIDKYGVSQTLDKIMRNQEIEILINVYYSPEIHEFSFELLDWTNHEYETTFD